MIAREPGLYPGATRVGQLCADAGVDAAMLARVASLPLDHARMILEGSLAWPKWPVVAGVAGDVVALLAIGGVDITVDELWKLADMDKDVRSSESKSERPEERR